MQQGGRMTVFHGAPFQRGYGIGSFFTSAGRVALPWVQKGLKTYFTLLLQLLGLSQNHAFGSFKDHQGERSQPY